MSVVSTSARRIADTEALFAKAHSPAQIIRIAMQHEMNMGNSAAGRVSERTTVAEAAANRIAAIAKATGESHG